ncbi:MAG TPA: hypothetical protein PK874_10440 [Desulfobacteraceae bacterium]|nr:hypothetical protein [Desulfobacteraceae bacterium]HPJ68624.1 hypothetical protein [Desulfobacteraceae bacterium]HPQ27531.1 hypothetical protein [Desulfobacteraceae bacterium]
MRAKSKKKFVVFAVIFSVMLFFAGASYASQWYWSMNIVKIAAKTTGTVITVRNDAGTVTVQKYVDPSAANELLAIALTADSQIKKVHVYHDTGTDYITAITISNE